MPPGASSASSPRSLLAYPGRDRLTRSWSPSPTGTPGWHAERMRRPFALLALTLSTILMVTDAAAAPRVDERELLGESFEGRPIRVFHRGDPEEIRVLVVGCIHGDECAGIRIARRLRTGEPRHFVDLWILPNLNPDGRAAHTRQNAR